MGQIHLDTCERMRELFSAALDGELSELDDARLEAPLAMCAGCRSYADTTAAAARLVRSAPLEDLDIQIVVPGRRLAVARRLQVTAAAGPVVGIAGVSGGLCT